MGGRQPISDVPPKNTSIYRQSGVIPYRIKKGRVEILLVTSRSGRRWVIPKGIVETGMSPRQSAAKEAREEAGIVGRLSRKSIGAFSYEKWSGVCEVEVFTMTVEQQFRKWEESIRSRKWFSLRAAAEKVDEKKLKQLIEAAGTRIMSKKAERVRR